MKNIRVFYLKNFIFLEVKFSIYLNRRVFVINPTLYSKTGVYRGIHYFSSAQKHRLWVIVEPPRRGGTNGYP